MRLRVGLCVVTLFLLVGDGLSGDEDSSTLKSRLRLRRPGSNRIPPGRTTSTTTTSSPTTTPASPTTPNRLKSPPSRSRFRLKTTTGKPSSSPSTTPATPLEIELADQEPQGSIAATRTVSRLKPTTSGNGKGKTKTRGSSTPASSSLTNGNGNGGEKEYKIVCYYTNWSQYRPKIGKFLPEDIPAHLCTHVIFAFGWMKKGKLSSFETQDETKDGKPGFYQRINNLKKLNPKLKTLLAIGKQTNNRKETQDARVKKSAEFEFPHSSLYLILGCPF